MGKDITDGQVLKGLLDTLVLSVLQQEDNYGFGILQAVRDRLGNEGSILRDATLYPLLHRLESKFFVKSYFKPGDRGTPRKYYRITENGEAHLASRTVEWKRVVEILQSTIFSQKER